MTELFKAVFFSIFILGSLDVHSSQDGFGRLFTTPEERRALDKLRHAGKTNHKVATVGKSKLPPVSISNAVSDVQSKDQGKKIGSVHLSGVILRSDGEKEVWVNGQLLSPASGLGAVVGKKQTVLLKKGGEEQLDSRIKLKVGQKWLPHVNKILDVYPNVKDE